MDRPLPGPPGAAEPSIPLVELRRPDGALSKFSEIVTPHPVAAFLFRRRTFIVQLGVLATIPFARPQWQMFLAGVIVAILAESLRVWAAGTIHKTEALTTGGPYALMRHPLYVGSFLHAVALCLMTGHWMSWLIVMPIFLTLYSAAVGVEEQMLLKVFGQSYQEYSDRVPRFIPRVRGDRTGHGQFAWKQVSANKEYINIIWMVVLTGVFAWLMIQRGPG